MFCCCLCIVRQNAVYLMHACNIRLCIGCMQQMCKCRVLSWFLYCHHLSCSCQNLCKCVPFLADILRFCQYSRQVLCILNIFRQAQLVMWICYAVHHCMIKVFIYVGNFCRVTTFLDNLEMSVNLTAVRELIRCQGIVGGEKSCWGKLSIAYFTFGAMSMFSRLLYCHLNRIFSVCWVILKHFALIFIVYW